MKKSELQNLIREELRKTLNENQSEKWANMNEEERENALLTAVKDPDDIDKYLDYKWQNLPPQIQSNIKL